MRLFNSFAVLAKISLVILVLKLTISVNNGEVRVVELGRVATKVICQGTTLKFKCKNSSLAMVIYAATYGRQEDGRTLCPFKEDLVDQSVIQANETDDNSVCSNEKNVTLEIMKLCDKKRRCIVTVNETYFGNPCKGIYKFLKIIYACEDRHLFKIRTVFPFYTPHTSYSTTSYTSPTPSTRRRPKTPRVTTLTKRKKVRTVNSTFRKSTARTTKAPKVTKRTTTPTTPAKTTSKRSLKTTLPSSKVPPKQSSTTANTSKNITPTTVTAVSKRQTTKKRRKKTTKKPRTVSKVNTKVRPDITVLTSEASVSMTTPVVSINSTVVTTKGDKTTETPTTSTGVQITIQVNGTNYTLPNRTEPVTEKPPILPTTGQEPSTKGVSSAAPVAMEQGNQAAVMGMAGSLYLWFLHMKENKSAYITVFILSALGAALIMVGVVSCFLTVQKKKEFLKLDIMHKPKRFIAPPKETKTTNENGHLPGKEEKVPEGEEAADGMMLHKGAEVVFTAHDVNNQIKKEFNIDRYSGMENGTAKKGDAASIHVNPMFNSSNNNKPPSALTNQNQAIPPGNDTVSSLPSTPARGRTQSEPRSGTPRRARANSTGNVSRSHERHHSQGITNYSEERLRLPRHLSAGNVSHQHRQGGHSDNASQNQSPARTLPRQRSATANNSYCQSPVRNPLHLQQGGSALPAPVSGASNSGVINNVSQQQSPARSVPNAAMLNQYPATSGTLNNRQQSQGSVSQPLSPSRSPQYGAVGQPLKSASGAVRRDGEQGSPLSVASGEIQALPGTHHSLAYQCTNLNSAMKLPNSSYAVLGKESNPGTPIPYSSHRSTPKSIRKWSEEKETNFTGPNITTNPNYNSKSGDIWQKHNEAKLGQKEPSTRSLSSDHSNIPGGILQRSRVSSETSATQEQDSSKGTLRAPSMGELLSPLDALPDPYANNPSLRFSDRHPYSSNPGTQSLHTSIPPPPPEQPTDSSDDDLYSIVAKGTYSSAVSDPYLRQTAGTALERREGKNKNKHVYVVVPSGDGSTAV